MTLEQIRTHGLRALVEELGTAGAVRFSPTDGKRAR